MKKIFYLLAILISSNSCDTKKNEIKTIDFKTDYKFSSQIKQQVTQDTVPWKYQFSASDYAKKGDYKSALIHWDLAMGKNEKSFLKSQIDSINQKYSKIKASDYIIEQAKNNQIIIINEAHHNSFHRVFTKSLLQKLFEIGYKNFGLEALTNDDSLNLALNNRNYPIQKTGWYIKEPQFGNLVREALEIGYELFAYENMNNGSGRLREIEQAKNIEAVISSKPNEKFIIHCGFDHVLEGIHQSWEKAMAERLKELTGINPLTINQVLYSERSDPKYNPPLLKALEIQESTIVIDKDHNPLKYERGEAWTDLAVFHPNTNYIDGRPDWLFEYGNKKISIPLNDIQFEFPVVYAFKKGEDINLAVPVDITEVKNQIDNCSLGLKPGEYTIVITNGKESIQFKQRIQ